MVYSVGTSNDPISKILQGKNDQYISNTKDLCHRVHLIGKNSSMSCHHWTHLSANWKSKNMKGTCWRGDYWLSLWVVETSYFLRSIFFSITREIFTGCASMLQTISLSGSQCVKSDHFVYLLKEWSLVCFKSAVYSDVPFYCKSQKFSTLVNALHLPLPTARSWWS